MSQRVLHVVASLVPQAGSLGVLLGGLLRAQTAGGWKPTVSVLDGHDDVRVDCPVYAGNEATAGKLVANADLVHIHGYGEPEAKPFAKAARKQGKPYIMAPHGVCSMSSSTRRGLWERLFGARSDKALLQSAGRVQALNTLEASELTDFVPAARITTLPYGMDSTAEAEPATSGQTDRVHDRLLMLGPIEPTEGAVVVLKAIAEVGQVADRWHVVIAGPNRGNYRAMLEAGIHRKGGEGRVRFASACDAAEQRSLLADAQLLVACGLRIRPPVSIMHAVSAGVPVLATDCMAPDELAEHLFVCRPDRAALRTRLREVLELDEEERNARTRGASECLMARLDWRVLVDRYADCYREVLQTAHR